MSLYDEQTTEETIKTTKYTRANSVNVYNPLHFPPTIEYQEERVCRLNDDPNTDKSEGRIGYVSETLTPENAVEAFALKNPVTGEDLGTTGTYTDLQVLIYSLYFHLVTKRDQE
jgi:hypothetical protein